MIESAGLIHAAQGWAHWWTVK